MSDIVNDIIAYEQGDLSASDTLSLFSHLVKTGTAWKLQGHYGRTAAAFIAYGMLTSGGDITDYARDILEGDE